MSPAVIRSVAFALSLTLVGPFARLPALAAEGPLPVQRPVGEGTVDWTNGRVEAQGAASPRVISPHSDWIEGDLRKEADERSLANLRDTLAAIPFDATRTTGEALGASKLQELADGAKESFRQTLSDGTALRRVWIPLDLVRLALGIGQPPGDPGADGAAVVVEARGAGLQPAFVVRLLGAGEEAIWSGQARYVSQRPRSLRNATLLKLTGAQGALGADALLDQASQDKLQGRSRPIVTVWVVTDSWIKP